MLKTKTPTTTTTTTTLQCVVGTVGARALCTASVITCARSRALAVRKSDRAMQQRVRIASACAPKTNACTEKGGGGGGGGDGGVGSGDVPAKNN